MKFSTYQGERSVAELTRRLFDIKGRKSEELRKQAEAALLRANPHLRELNKASAGMPIVVPDVPGVEPAKATPPITLGQDVLGQLRRALAGAHDAIERAVASETDDNDTAKEVLKNRLLKDLGRQVPDLEKRITQVTDGVKARQKEIAAFKTSSARDLAQLQKDFAQLGG